MRSPFEKGALVRIVTLVPVGLASGSSMTLWMPVAEVPLPAGTCLKRVDFASSSLNAGQWFRRAIHARRSCRVP